MMEETKTRKHLDVPEIRQRLAQSGGQEYWRSLDELAQSEEFAEMVHREFPEQASELRDPVSRRNFLKLMGASLAFGGLTGCTIQPTEKIVPQVRAPEELIPGKPLFYATAIPLGGIATGVLVESHMGRPTKIEGNGEHPASLGGTHAIEQASVLDLYDPDRSQTVKNAGRLSTWNSFQQLLNQQLEYQRIKQGAGLRILLQTTTSPTLGSQVQALLKEFPRARVHQWEPANRDNARNGAVLAYGEPLNTYCDFSKARVIFSLDADFAHSGPGSARYARDFAAGRRVRDGHKDMNRLYMAESTPTATGSVADHRLALDTGQIEALAMQVARGLGASWEGPEGAPLAERSRWIGALVRDLEQHRGRSLVVAGDQQAPAVHALAHAMNQALGNVGHTVFYTAPLEIESVDQAQSLKELVQAMNAGQVDALFVLGGNPVFEAPADLGFAAALERVSFRTHLGLYENETAELCHWHIPESHYLESWSDARAYNGLVSIVQPLIEPLYKTKSAHELLAAMTGKTGVSGYDLVREHWQSQNLALDFEPYWRRSLHDGFLAGSEHRPRAAALSTPLRLPAGAGTPLGEEDLELHFRPHPLVWDGRFANNGWLQETPHPIAKLTWDNAVFVSPATAERLRLKNAHIAELRHGGQVLRAAVWVVPGQASNVLTLHLGYGQKRAGRVARGTGFNAYALRSSAALWSGRGLQVSGTHESYPLASTQEHHSMEGRALVRNGTLEHYKHEPDFALHMAHDPPEDLTLYNRTDHVYKGYSWGMVIDLGACIGCNACSVACQAENNIPVVGKEQVLNGREMSWIRIDRYYKGELDDPEIVHQPVPCMQCENAPCEVVCPVGATVHSAEGLNDMAYNRCVGTRYCLNNCPYKVRRFNFLLYTDKTESLKLQRNPDVTVRARGVMEKCTYCVQRINSARIDTKKAGRKIRDLEILTACQQACPTEAIVFGDINDPDSAVSRLKKLPLNYGILTDLNTRPRTTYLAGLKNPNPEIAES